MQGKFSGEVTQVYQSKDKSGKVYPKFEFLQKLPGKFSRLVQVDGDGVKPGDKVVDMLLEVQDGKYGLRWRKV